MRKQEHLLRKSKSNLLQNVLNFTKTVASTPEDVDFTKVAGLDEHIASLKEMVVIPLLYPELFANFQITPPRYEYKYDTLEVFYSMDHQGLAKR